MFLHMVIRKREVLENEAVANHLEEEEVANHLEEVANHLEEVANHLEEFVNHLEDHEDIMDITLLSIEIVQKVYLFVIIKQECLRTNLKSFELPNWLF